jgi:hypothetical protein
VGRSACQPVSTSACQHFSQNTSCGLRDQCRTSRDWDATPGSGGHGPHCLASMTGRTSHVSAQADGGASIHGSAQRVSGRAAHRLTSPPPCDELRHAATHSPTSPASGGGTVRGEGGWSRGTAAGATAGTAIQRPSRRPYGLLPVACATDCLGVEDTSWNRAGSHWRRSTGAGLPVRGGRSSPARNYVPNLWMIIAERGRKSIRGRIESGTNMVRTGPPEPANEQEGMAERHGWANCQEVKRVRQQVV